MKYIFGFLIALIAVSACKKKEITYVVEGVITDNSYSQPLAGATVDLYEIPLGSSTPSTVLASATTGSDGKYHFEFKREKIEKYVIVITKNGYFSTSTEFHADDLSTQETNTFSHTTTAKSWVKLRFINTDAGVNLKYIRQSGKMDCDECCASTDQYLYDAVDTAIYCINDGNTTYSYYYWVLGTTINGPKSVVTTPFDTVDLVLNY